MKKYSELQVGVTVILSLIVLIGGVLWFKGFTVGHDTYTIDVYLPQASGLSKGDGVEVAGVVQGKVDAITYDKGQAHLVLSINNSAEIYSDAVVSVTNFGLMGQKFVSINPGTHGNPVLDGSVPLQGRYEAGPADMMVMAGQSLESVNRLITRIDAFLAVVDSAGGAKTVSRTLNNADRLTADLADVAATTKTDLKASIRNFNEASAGLKSILDDKGPELRTTLDNFNSASARVDSLTAVLTDLSREARTLLDKASSKESSVGALLEDRELYENLLSTVSRTDSLLLDIKRHPRKYFKFSVF